MGRAAAIAFAREGADVAFNYLPVEEPDAQEVVQLITEPQHLHADCRRVGYILGRVGDKWTILLLMAIGDRRMRFGELQRAIGGISPRMLTVTLRKLEHDGILIRTFYPTIPLRVEYELSDRGRSLKLALAPIGKWARLNPADFEGATNESVSRKT
jgi:DNA-binding HxlR family transcriptional regulator